MWEFLRDWLTLSNAPNAFIWVIILLLFAHGIGRVYEMIASGMHSRRVIHPDQEGRYPVILLENRKGVVAFDRERGWGLTMVEENGDIKVYDTPDQLIANQRDIEIARAASKQLPPAALTDSRNIHATQEQLTYAPSNTREETNVNSDNTEEETEDGRPPLPKVVNLFENIDVRDEGHVIMGVGEDGNLVQVPINQLFHHLVGGMSGWGKSIYLRSLVYQLMREADTHAMQIGLADIENNTFPEFRGKNHIRWYASNALEIEHMTSNMIREVERRKALYDSMKGGTPKDIDRYNALARREGKEELPIAILIYDEFSAFMVNRAQAQQKRILADIYQLALRARKYGIFLVLAGQSFKSDVVDSTVIGQFGFNVCFRVRTVQASMSIIGSPGAESITQQGEALMRTKTGEIVRLQALYVDDDELIEALTVYEMEDHSSLVPDSVKEIVGFSRDMLQSKVLFRDLELHFRSKGLSRKDLMSSLEWMDQHHFTLRNEKNARVLNEEIIAEYMGTEDE